MEKKPSLYILIMTLWTIAVGVLIYALVHCAIAFPEPNALMLAGKIVLLAATFFAVAFMLLTGIRDSVFQIAYLFSRKRTLKMHEKIAQIQIKDSPRVAVIYCTCDDFCEDALTKSMKQDYSNYYIVLCDDSKKPENQAALDKFISDHPEVEIKLSRRTEHKGFKAGNINNYLKNTTDEFDYIVVLDSDEVIPENFITSAIKYFIYDEKLGALQAAHKATKGKNIFQSLMGMCVKSEAVYAQIAKDRYGLATLCGHGMMLSRQAVIDAGFFPELVVEDCAISIKIREAGYEIGFTPTILCEEEYPSNYIIAKKRTMRWQEGFIEIEKKLKDSMLSKNIPLYQRIDLQISQTAYYRTLFCTMAFVVLPILMALLRFNLGNTFSYIYPIMTVTTAMPLLKDILVYLPTKEFWKLPFYLILNALVYSSWLPSMFIRAMSIELGLRKPYFLVTKKGQHRVVALQILRHSIMPFIFIAIIGAATYFAYHSIEPSLSIIAAGALSPIFIVLANIEYRQKKPKTEIVFADDNEAVHKL